MIWCISNRRLGRATFDAWSSAIRRAIGVDTIGALAIRHDGHDYGFQLMHQGEGTQSLSYGGRGSIRIDGVNYSVCDSRIRDQFPRIVSNVIGHRRPLYGQHSLAFVHSDSLYLINDFYGNEQVYYLASDGKVIASNDLRAILAFPALEIEENPDFTKKLFEKNIISGDVELVGETAYRGVKKLPSGYFLHVPIDASTPTLVEYDVDLAGQKQFDGSFSEAVESFEEILTRVVSSAGPSQRRLFDMSGGLDSSNAIAAAVRNEGSANVLVASLLADPSTSYYSADDEIIHEFRQAARLIGFDTDFQSTLARSLDFKPFLGPRTLANYGYLAEAQRYGFAQNCTQHMTGEGGDFHFLETPLLDDCGVSSLAHLIDRRGRKISARTPMAFVLRTLLANAKRHEYIHRHIYRMFLWPELQQKSLDFVYRYARGRGEKAKLESERRFRRQFVPWCKRLHYDMLYPRAMYNEEFCHFPIQIVAPFLDLEMIEFSFSLPPSFFVDLAHYDPANDYAGSKQILRSAFRDIIPPEIGNKRVKTNYNAMAIELFERNFADITDCVNFLFENNEQALSVFDRASIDLLVERLRIIAKLPGCSFGVDSNLINILFEAGRWQKLLSLGKPDFLRESFANYRYVMNDHAPLHQRLAAGDM